MCGSCIEELRNWKNGKKKSLHCGIPMIWTEHTNHGDDCYFCTVKLAGYTAKRKKDIVYPSIPHGTHIPLK